MTTRHAMSCVGAFPLEGKLSSKSIKPGARFWTAVSLFILIALTIIFDSEDFAFIQTSLERTRKGSTKNESRNDPRNESIHMDPTISSSTEHKPNVSSPTTSLTSDKSQSVSNNPNASVITYLNKSVTPTTSFTATPPSPRIAGGNDHLTASDENSTNVAFAFVPVLVTSNLTVASNPTHTVNLKSSVPTASNTAPLTSKRPSLIVNVSRTGAVQTPSSCRRSCKHYNNKIFFSSPGGAGLSDRMYVISRSLQLAGYLCARLYISRPRFWLAASHNHGDEVDVRMTWDDFAGSFRFLDDGSNNSALVDWVNPENATLLPQVRKIKRSRKYRTWPYIRTEHVPDIVAHFEQVEAISFSDEQGPQQSNQPKGFLWDIQPNFYHWIKPLVKLLEQRHLASSSSSQLARPTKLDRGHSNLSVSWRINMLPFGSRLPSRDCTYVSATAPKEVVQMVDNVFDKLRVVDTLVPADSYNLSYHGNSTLVVPRPWIGYFHVRRGDTIDQCITTLDRIEQFLNCSVGEPLAALAKAKRGQVLGPRRQVIVLFSSDERSMDYRHELGRLVEQLQYYPFVNTTFKVSFADLDELGRREITTAIERGTIPAWRLSNFYLYRVVSSVEWGRPEITFRLEQRRTTCPVCTNITYHIIWSHALTE